MAGNDVYKVIYLLCLPVYMAKLYWRIKRDGKWTWVAATSTNTIGMNEYDPELMAYQEEEE